MVCPSPFRMMTRRKKVASEVIASIYEKTKKIKQFTEL